MDVWRITVALLRRWYVFIPLLALSGWGAVMVGQGVRPEYAVEATAVLVAGPGASDVDGPYGGRESTSEVLAIVLDSAASRDLVEKQGLERDYEIETQERSSIIRLDVLSDSESVGTQTLATVLQMSEQELAARQDKAGIRPNAQISLQVLQQPAVDEVVETGKMRNMAIVGVIGAAFSLLITLLFDDIMGLLRRRLSRRRERRPQPATSASEMPEAAGVDPSETSASDAPVPDYAPAPSRSKT